jgi:hypothetical protein
MREFELVAAQCWQCGKVLEVATETKENEVPEDGDVSMCLMCGALGFYQATDGGLSVRRATPEELDELRQDEFVRQLLAVRARVIG